MQEMNNTNAAQVTIMLQGRSPEVREAQNRKGEVEFFNASLAPEARLSPDTVRTKPVARYMTQIPVKLRTNEKAVKP